MAYLVHIQNHEEPIIVDMGQTILESALTQGIDYPHGCRSGNCGACKSILLSGDVEMSPYSDFALAKDEKDRGLILACRAVPWSNCSVRPIDEDDIAVYASRHLTCKVIEILEGTHDIRIIRLAIMSGGPYEFAAGQYAEVGFNGVPVRDYSMANQPGQECLEFHIRLIQGGIVSLYVDKELETGETVMVKGPFGTAFFRENHTGPIIAAAGGSGLAPIKSIVETALAKGASQNIYFYFGVRDRRDMYFYESFLALSAKYSNLNFIPVLSEPSSDTEWRRGFLSDALEEDFTDLNGFKAYLAGPPVMVETSIDKLKKMNIQPFDIHADAFYTQAEKLKLENK